MRNARVRHRAGVRHNIMLGPTNDAGVRHNAGALPNDGLLHVMLASDMALGSDISSGALGTCCLVAILAQVASLIRSGAFGLREALGPRTRSDASREGGGVFRDAEQALYSLHGV